MIRQGDVPDDLFVVVAGTLQVSASTPEGEHAVAELGPGHFFGEIGLLRQVPRVATVRTLDAVPSLPHPGAGVPGDRVPGRRPVADPHACRSVPVGRAPVEQLKRCLETLG